MSATLQWHYLLKCQACNNFLSVFPINSTGNTKFQCGRCTPKPNAQRQYAYEEVIKDKPFPCRFEKFGCSTNLPPEQLKDHEKKCTYMVIMCQVNGCNWTDSLKQLADHLFEKHKTPILEECTYYATPINNAEMKHFLLIKLDAVFLVRLQRLELKLIVNVAVLDENNALSSYMYKLYFLHGATGGVLKFGPKIATNTETSNNNLIINFNEVDFSSINWKIKIIRKDKANLDQPNPSLEFILKQLECPVCIEYMSSQIYQCPNGHAICCTCKKKITNCPQCREIIGNSRNLPLESIAPNTFLPCQNEGCSFISTLTNHKKHANECQYVPYKCVFTSCNYLGIFNDLLNHLQEKHRSNLNINKFHSAKILNTTFKQIIIKNNCIYMLLYVMDSNMFQLRVEYLGPKHVKNTFAFDLIMQNSADERIDFKSKCFDKDSHKNVCNFMLPSLFIKQGKSWKLEVNIVDTQ